LNKSCRSHKTNAQAMDANVPRAWSVSNPFVVLRKKRLNLKTDASATDANVLKEWSAWSHSAAQPKKLL